MLTDRHDTEIGFHVIQHVTTIPMHTVLPKGHENRIILGQNHSPDRGNRRPLRMSRDHQRTSSTLVRIISIITPSHTPFNRLFHFLYILGIVRIDHSGMHPTTSLRPTGPSKGESRCTLTDIPDFVHDGAHPRDVTRPVPVRDHGLVRYIPIHLNVTRGTIVGATPLDFERNIHGRLELVQGRCGNRIRCDGVSDRIQSSTTTDPHHVYEETEIYSEHLTHDDDWGVCVCLCCVVRVVVDMCKCLQLWNECRQ